MQGVGCLFFFLSEADTFFGGRVVVGKRERLGCEDSGARSRPLHVVQNNKNHIHQVFCLCYSLSLFATELG